ncbi:hypothetical protein ATK86_6574 [Nocardia fluminea]|uniref:Uncharacterized protein n=1 Tax=Nocardia fluminea TaxID=134984 RepID=A0A2N3VKE3_9NOCA|nr:hypothetical protein ATK86_6574 [Nocardia fluminea]
MTHLVPDIPEPSLTDLTRTLDAMREAGFITIAPPLPRVDATEPHSLETGLPEERT